MPRPTVAALASLTALAAFSDPAQTGAAPTRPSDAPAVARAARTESPLRDRRAFARLLAQVKSGMPREKVRKLLGKPDDIWRGGEVEACRRGFVYRQGKEAWAYGGDGHLTYPTLGMVRFDGRGKVVAVVGHGERLPGASLPPEPQTRRILRAMDRLKSYDQHNDPLRVIQVVNALQPLGKAGALAVIDEYLRSADVTGFGGGRDGVFVVVRCLFNVPEPPGYFPVMHVGAPIPDSPKDLRHSPRFPVVLYRDIPFSGISGYSLAGSAEDPEGHLTPYREWGTIRARPLRPPDNPLAVIDELVSSPEWPDWGPAKDGAMSVAREQALRLVDPVYRVEENEVDGRLSGFYEEQEPQWRTHVQRFARVNARWDAVRSTYVRPDGTFLPPRPEPNTYPRIWRVRTPNGMVEVALQRAHRTSVGMMLSARGAKPPMPLLRMFIGTTEIKTDDDQHVPADESRHTGFSAPEGSDIRLVLEQKGKIVAETVLRP